MATMGTAPASYSDLISAIIVLEILFLLLLLFITLGLLYLYFLLIAGLPQVQTSTAAASSEQIRFAIAIAAHNEAEVIGNTVKQLQHMDYPPELFDVHVVADYCNDETVVVARAAGAQVYERESGPRGRKGYALDWLLQRLLTDPRHYDAITIFDADSLVDVQFLSAMALKLTAGSPVVQGQHIIQHPEQRLFNALAHADMRLNNHIRNRAKENLGLSARLMGDAMAFRREILERFPWQGVQSLTEDRAYGLYLITQGVRIHYAPAAISYGQGAGQWRDATPQRLRWYSGAFDLQHRYLLALGRLAWRHGNLDALDKFLELALPPYSFLAAGALLLFLLQTFFDFSGDQPSFFLTWSTVLIISVVAYPFLGLIATRSPWPCYRALLAGPFYVLWRLGIGLWVRLHRGQRAWMRTPRSPNTHPTKQ